MATITTDRQTFNAECWNTLIVPFCVKKQKPIKELFDDPQGHGVIVSPAIERGSVTNDAELHAEIRAFNSTVVVRGHGWDFEEPFVWSGTPEEFCETWIGD